MEIIIILTGLQSINCYKATSEFFINLEGKQDVMDAKWPEYLFKRQVQFHAQAMKKVPSQEFPYFLPLTASIRESSGPRQIG